MKLEWVIDMIRGISPTTTTTWFCMNLYVISVHTRWFEGHRDWSQQIHPGLALIIVRDQFWWWEVWRGPKKRCGIGR
jgi:hypothetical protein